VTPLEEMTVATRPIERVEPDRTPAELGRYRLYERLGTGGMATVYRARRADTADARDVALKRLHPHLVADELAVASFGREARIAYLLDHPVIRRVFALCRDRDELFMTMEYIDGRPLSGVLQRFAAARRQRPVRGVIAIIDQLCRALHYAHVLVDENGDTAGFVHRDVSPSNLIVSANGDLKLIDMGLARARASGHRTDAGVVKGKYGYMAPEVMWSRPFDHRADVFSVGVVAWELLTARKLYRVSSPSLDIARVRARPLEPPTAYNSRCPPELGAVVLRALAADPAGRWASCAAMAASLRQVAEQLELLPVADSIASVVRAAEGLSRRPRLARGTTTEPVVLSVPAVKSVPTPHRTARHSPVLGAVACVALAFAIAATAGVPLPAAPATRESQVARGGVASERDGGVVDDARYVDAEGALTVDMSDVERLDGPWPRSRTASYAYRASVCIDERGAVASAGLLEGPPRLERRITRALLRWRYEPYTRDGRPRPACFELESQVHKKARARRD
jgi:serine/threonine protein kinase